MIVHKCDICMKEMGVWLDVDVSIGSHEPTVNVADMLYLRGKHEVCKSCFKRLKEEILK